jgi:hemophore-related protein
VTCEVDEFDSRQTVPPDSSGKLGSSTPRFGGSHPEGVPHMVTRSMSKLAAAAGGLALVALAGAGVASADGLSEQAINTTCNYGQVHAALQAQNQLFASLLDSHPDAQQFLQDYLASGPAARRVKAQNALTSQDPQIKSHVSAAIPVLNQVAVTCNNF